MFVIILLFYVSAIMLLGDCCPTRIFMYALKKNKKQSTQFHPMDEKKKDKTFRFKLFLLNLFKASAKQLKYI